MTERWLSVAEAAERTGFTPEVIRRAIRRGELRAYKPLGRLKIAEEDLDAWMREHPAAQETAAEALVTRQNAARSGKLNRRAAPDGGSFVARARRAS